jgi:hypothetical protein
MLIKTQIRLQMKMSRLKGYTQIIKHAELHVVFRRGNKNSG